MFVYLDESGKLTSRDDIKRPTLAAIVLPEDSLEEATRELLSFKRKFGPFLNEEEMHPEFELKSSNLLRASAGGWKHEITDRFFTEYLRSIPGLQVAAIVMRRLDTPIQPATEILPLPHRWLMNNIYAYLDCHDIDAYATFVYDSTNPKEDARLSRAFTGFLYKHGAGVRLREKITPTPLFASSDLHAGIQIADLVAGCLSRQASLYEKVEEDQQFSSVEERSHYQRLDRLQGIH